MQFAFILASIAACGYGLTTIIYKTASSSIDPLSQSLIVSLSTTITLLLLWIVAVSNGYTPLLSTRGSTIASAGGVVAAAALVAYISAVSAGDAGVASTVRSLSFLVTILLSVTFFSEILTPMKIAGIVTAIISLLLLSIHNR